MEVWLQPNRRALYFGCVPPALLAASGLLLLIGSQGSTGDWLFWSGAGMAFTGLVAVLAIARQLRQPRIAFRDGQVLFYLRAGEPFVVPASVVEAFFVGQSPVVLSGGQSLPHRSLNLVARLSQREIEWAERKVKPALGEWREGYITVRGAWCEPISEGLVRRINRRLKEVQTCSPMGRT